MVPQPVWLERPQNPLLTADPTEHTNPDKPAEPLPFLKNVSGRFWKQPHGATQRAQAGKKDKSQTSAAFARREEQRKKDEGVRKLEKCVASSLY